MNDDLIKRSNVYKAVDDWLEGKVPNLNIKGIPSEDRPQGKWIDDGDTIICNKCGTAYNRPIFHNGWNYCPNCGADMIGKR